MTQNRSHAVTAQRAKPHERGNWVTILCSLRALSGRGGLRQATTRSATMIQSPPLWQRVRDAISARAAEMEDRR